MMPGRRPSFRGLRLAGAAAAIVLIAVPALAQTPMDDPLDARDARRVDRMEKVVRELRDIVFKAQRTGAPVVVQPADTDSRLADLATRLNDLEQSLTKLNGTLEVATHELDQTRRDNAALKAQVKALGDRLTAFFNAFMSIRQPSSKRRSRYLTLAPRARGVSILVA